MSAVQLVSFETGWPFVIDALVEIHKSLVANVIVLHYNVRHLEDPFGLLQVGPCGKKINEESDGPQGLSHLAHFVWGGSDCLEDKMKNLNGH